MLEKLHWQSIDKVKYEADKKVVELLGYTKEMTPLLQEKFPNIEVLLKFQDSSEISSCEAVSLNIEANKCICREVVLQENTNIIMFARSIIHPEILSEEKLIYDALKNGRLGKEILFNKKYNIKREYIEYLKLNSSNWLYQKVELAFNEKDKLRKHYWARKSLFTKDNKPFLLLTDVFNIIP